MNVIGLLVSIVLGLPLEHVLPLAPADPIAEAVCVLPMCVYHPWVPDPPYTAECPNLCVWNEKEEQICTDSTPESWDCAPNLTAKCWWDCNRIF